MFILFRLQLKWRRYVNALLMLYVIHSTASDRNIGTNKSRNTTLNNSINSDVEVSVQSGRHSGYIFKRACYLDSEGDIDADHIDPFLCTHLLLFYSHVNDAGKPVVTEDGIAKISKAVKLKNLNPFLLLSLTIGGTNKNFALASSSHEKRTLFANELINIITFQELDGVDLDWEFPGFFNDFTERRNFTLMLGAIRNKLKLLKSYKYLSTAVAAPSVIVDLCYEVREIAKLVDFVSIMSYDFHLFSVFTPSTGHNAPLFASRGDREYFAQLNTNFSVHYWIGKGMPRDKILIGLPTYGRGYVLLYENMHGLYAPAEKPLGDGYVGFADVCTSLNEGGVEVWDPHALVSFAYNDKLWYSYANVRSIEVKAVYARTLGVAGVMTFDLNRDDPFNNCKLGAFPLHNTIRDILI